MKKKALKNKALYISQKLILGLIALQFLNMSVCSEAYWDNDYDYMGAYNNSACDPTETAVEWLVEMKYGQQQAFTYDQSTDVNKNIARSFHWHTDLQSLLLPVSTTPIKKIRRGYGPAQKLLSPSTEIISPPPERDGPDA